MASDRQRAALLAEFTDKLNHFSPESKEVREFCAQHESDAELVKLFRTAAKVQSQLRKGQFSDETESRRISTQHHVATRS